MNKIFCLISWLFVASLNSMAQKQSLYFIISHVHDGTDQFFNSFLTKHSHDSLIMVAQLSEAGHYSAGAKEAVESIKYYYDENLITVYKTNKWDVGRDKTNGIKSEYIKILTGGEKPNLSYHQFGFNDRLVSYYLTNKKKIFLRTFNINTNPKSSSYYHDFTTLSLTSINPSQLKDLMVTGYPGGAIDGADYLLVYSNEDNGKLTVPLTSDINERPVLPYILPDSLQFKSYSRHVINVNNEHYFFIKGNKVVKESAIGSHEQFVYHKAEKKWKTYQIKGDIPRIRAFGEWVGGYVFNKNIGKDLPGTEQWKPYRRKTGLTPAERFRTFSKNPPSAYAPGILYIMNPKKDIYYEWETRQADSEVVLVDNGCVIYRVYDELYRANINSNNTLDEGELLLKDEMVPDIHWGFYTKK